MKVTITNKELINRQINIKVDSTNFNLKFVQIARKSVYYFLLDRIWFWGSLKKVGFNPIICTDQDPDLKIEIIEKEFNTDILY